MKQRFLLLLLILLAFALRIHDLDAQSMWSDEGLSLYRARLPLSELLANTIVVDTVVTRDTNPPFYFLLLHFWIKAAGSSIFAMRYLGAAAATAAIPLMFLVGRRAYNWQIGLVAAGLLALSPFHIWQAQILRNYGLLLTLNLFSVYGLFRVLLAHSSARRWPWFLLWAGSSLLGIYTHYFGFFVFAFGLLSLGLSALRDDRIRSLVKQRWTWLASLGLVLLLLPVLPIALDRFQMGQQVDFYPVPWDHIVTHALGTYSVGFSPTVTHSWWRVAPALLLLAAGIIFGGRRRPTATLLLLGYQVIPLGILLLLSLLNPLYNGVRHLLIGLPPFLLLVAAGAVSLRKFWRRIMLTVATLLLISQVTWLWAQFNQPQFLRDDIRGAAAYLGEQAQPEDVIILHDSLIQFTFDYYYTGAAPVVIIPFFGQSDEAQAIARLEAAAGEADRVWFLTEPTPRTGFDRTRLSEHAESSWMRIYQKRFPSLWLGVRLRGYQPHFVVEKVPPGSSQIDAGWPPLLQLHGYDIPETVVAGEQAWLTFYLSPLEKIEHQLTFSLRLVDEQGQVWSQIDNVVGQGKYAPSAWQENRLYRYDHQVTIPTGLAPGRYQFQLRLVQTDDGQTHPLASGNLDLPLANVAVQTASCTTSPGTWPVDSRADIALGPLNLAGYTVPSGSYRPGHALVTTLLWCARQAPEENYRVRLQLLSEKGQLVAETIASPGPTAYPPERWERDEMIMGQIPLSFPADAPQGDYQIHLSLLPAQDDRALWLRWPPAARAVPLGQVTVDPWPLETQLPEIASPHQATFEVAELHGYQLTEQHLTPGESTSLTLYWRGAQQTPLNYLVFVHLLDETGQIVAQADGPPVSGIRPTSGWRTGEVLVDEHLLTIPPEVVPGDYQLWIGFYDPDTGQRLPASGTGAAGDRVLLQRLTVREADSAGQE